MVFNGDYTYFHLFINFPCYSMETIEIFIFLSIFHVSQWCNGALEPNCAEVPLCSTGHHSIVPFGAAALLTYKHTNNCAEVPLCSTGHCPLWGHCPANIQTYKAGQRVSLTTYCPWATGYYILMIHEHWTKMPMILQSISPFVCRSVMDRPNDTVTHRRVHLLKRKSENQFIRLIGGRREGHNILGI